MLGALVVGAPRIEVALLATGAAVLSACTLVTDFSGLGPLPDTGGTGAASSSSGASTGGTTTGSGGAGAGSATSSSNGSGGSFPCMNASWAQSFGTPSLAGGVRLDIAPDGSIVLVGRTANTLFVERRDPNSGAVLFHHDIGQADLSQGEVNGGVGAGNIVIGGESPDPLDLDIDGVTDPDSTPGIKAFVAAYSLDGAPKWHKYYGGTQTDGVWVWAATPASDGSIVLGGEFKGTLPFGGACAPIASSSVNDVDGFVARIDASGSCLWATSFGGTDQASIISVAADLANDRVIASGNFGTSVTLPSPLTPISGPEYETFVVGFTAEGTPLYGKDAGFLATEGGISVTAEPSGSALLVGTIEGQTPFDPTQPTNASKEIIAAELDANGNVVWARLFGGGGADHGFAGAPGDSGTSWMGGYVVDNVDFDGTLLNGDPTTPDLFIAHLSPKGQALAAVRFGDASGWQDVSTLRPHPCGGLAIAGRFSGTLDFGTGTTALMNPNGSNLILYAARITVAP